MFGAATLTGPITYTCYCCRGLCYTIQSDVNLHVATILVSVRHFDRKFLCQLQTFHLICSVIDEDLRSRDVLLSTEIVATCKLNITVLICTC